ncbi:arsenite-transporting ATPase [Candidatus Kryptobacter tengchongensis]|uniref:arsenite-transporting ATPase n=1 Tax=Kryptobacter tengchongensis TaxID=1643429 RepID=A0A656DDN7_KRYT1|nr:ArsA family ATPase [Candidatus Kryptobacter tengchongensis]CUS99713.1 arsenite-transporting ATPase [Candidatus Kryptobacter tengchongensis]CUT03368.1 arsenite-transporting ATPase [Candidatus Kryptobacter tengchongensis]CUU04636.1 arsenite-transporting ATPase [Candidatus Kryptobacter tengchongensis]CUU05743.1 arsenite-transporting ATPase [Candidatus Kryptobacter tengchongensis]
MRVIIYTGKGGVGKTTISAATGALCAELGYKTIVISTDPAHSLSDSFGKKIGKNPIKITNKLWAQEIDVNEELRINWDKIQGFIVKFLSYQGFDKFMAEEFAIFPGLEELFSLLKINEYYDKETYDVIIVDCAPTANTIRMLSFPDIVSWYMERFFPLERKLVKTIRPVAEKVVKFPLPTDDVYAQVEELYRKIERAKEILTNPKISSVRLVLNPEKMVIKESQRAYTYLNLFEFPVDLIIINKVLPDEIDDEHFKKWKLTQTKHIETVKEAFDPIPIKISFLYNDEVTGLNKLLKFAQNLFNDEDPTKIYYSEKPIQIEEKNGRYFLKLKMPYFTKKDINVWVKNDELIIELPSFRRNIFLPYTLASSKVKEASLNDGILTIEFEKIKEG